MQTKFVLPAGGTTPTQDINQWLMHVQFASKTSREDRLFRRKSLRRIWKRSLKTNNDLYLITVIYILYKFSIKINDFKF